MKSNSDHADRRNYDDFNEFFWSRDCLKYHYSIEDTNAHYDMESNGMLGALLERAYQLWPRDYMQRPRPFWRSDLGCEECWH